MPSGIDEIKGTVLTFDFVISELEKYYSKTSPKNAYNDVDWMNQKDAEYSRIEEEAEEDDELEL